MTPSKTLRSALLFIAKWAIAGLAFALVLVWIRPDLRQPSAAPVPSSPTPLAAAAPAVEQSALPAPAPKSSYADAVAESAPSVVSIYTAELEPHRPGLADRSNSNRLPGAPQRIRTTLGSGVIVDVKGHIITNYHVIANAADIDLQLADGRIARDVTVVGEDPATDLAVLRINLDKLPTMKLGRSDKLRRGDIVLAIGNPYGLSQTVTQGIVSATGRDQLGLSEVAVFESYIQTDAAINLGNSGGALINTDGELIGINTAVLGQNVGVEGISFAIPVNLVRGVLEQILKFGHVRRGWLGVNSQTVSAQRAQALGLPQNVGVELFEVYADSPAARAGLQAGDVLTALNGVPVRTDREAMNRVAALAPGKQLRIEARRGAEKIDVRVKVEERKAETKN